MYDLIRRHQEVIEKIDELNTQILKAEKESEDSVQFLRGLLTSLKEEQNFWENTLKNTIFIAWCVEDVLSINPLLSEEDANNILEDLLKHHDAELGINWTTIEDAIDLYLDDEYNLKSD